MSDTKSYVEETYLLKDIGGGVVSKNQALRHFREKHPEYNVFEIKGFKVNSQTLKVTIRVLVSEKKSADCIKQDQKLLNPGYDELKAKNEKLVQRLRKDYSRVCHIAAGLRDEVVDLQNRRDKLQRESDKFASKLKYAEEQIEEFKKGAEGRPCLCGKCADGLNPGYDALMLSRNKLVDELAESEKQILKLQRENEELEKQLEVFLDEDYIAGDDA